MLRAIVCGLVLLAPFPAAAAAGDKKGDAQGLKVEDQITKDDPQDTVRMGSHRKVHTFKMTAGKTYVIDMITRDPGKNFDPYLRLEDPDGKQVAQDDDGGGFPNARITFTAERGGEYKIIATTFGQGMTGKYLLTVRQASPAEGALGALKQKFNERSQELQKSFFAAKTDEAKEEIKGKFFEAAAEHAERLSQFAQQHKGDPAAQLAGKELGQVLQMLGQADSPAVGKVLRNMLEKSTQKDLKGQLGLLVGQGLRGQYEKAYQKNDKEGAAKLAAEAEDLLKRVAKEFGDLPGPGGQGTIRKQAEDALFLLNNLSVGKVAPDIEGQDLDGKKFKLSDYRGKVVVLDFWAFW
jgi:hypothetical protein